MNGKMDGKLFWSYNHAMLRIILARWNCEIVRAHHQPSCRNHGFAVTMA